MNRFNSKEKEDIEIRNLNNERCGTQFNFSFINDNKWDEILRRPRSRAYLEAVAAIDMFAKTENKEEILDEIAKEMDQDTFEEFSEMTNDELEEEVFLSIEDELGEVKDNSQEAVLEKEEEKKPKLIGMVVNCGMFLHDCHAILFKDNIWIHYSSLGPILEPLVTGRALLKKNKKCASIEVYEDCCRIIAKDGSVTTVPNSEINTNGMATVKSMNELDLVESKGPFI